MEHSQIQFHIDSQEQPISFLCTMKDLLSPSCSNNISNSSQSEVVLPLPSRLTSFKKAVSAHSTTLFDDLRKDCNLGHLFSNLLRISNFTSYFMMTSIITLSIFSQTWALHKREIGTFFDCNSCETASAILKHFVAESVKTASIFSPKLCRCS